MAVVAGYSSGAINYYAWLNWKANFILGMTDPEPRLCIPHDPHHLLWYHSSMVYQELEAQVMYITDFEALSKAARDENFCVVCLQIRTDVPVVQNCCYECGGGKETP